MPDILPPQLAGVQQRPFYVKARTVLTAVSTAWLILAIAGYGSFSGGTTSLALSLSLMYGTGIAILVVASALYRLLKRSAVRRSESVPEDSAAAVFLDATRSATEELLDALAPSRAQRLPSSVLPAAVSRDAGAPAAAASPAAAAEAGRPGETKKKAQPAAANAKKPGQQGTAGAAPRAKNAGPQPKQSSVKSPVNKKAPAKKKSKSSTAAKAAARNAAGGEAGLKKAA
ncbi:MULTISPECIES: hypothetical protein [Arthrobacter]|uniref:hypothetical protein n=1 Tax=Arthrobacter TaxID=1663 RepID=UPI001D141753|nr:MULTISPECIES: hypothetical protein [Arthrobacter]MCC3283861.1 hypothetical protein [Arthrobacter caoxuetaonis]MCC9194033.1 hypothetical protein [Arthrobacter sp. zg-Y916]